MKSPLISACLFCLLTGSATAGNEYKVEKVLEGKASYYYGKWIGRKTANGEIYRRGDMTAAHKSLPFGTNVRVLNLQNGREVVVRINNRGPYIKGRIIDLSLAAAEKLGMTKAGVVPVKVEVLAN
jgi:rare lipoprotein A